jgi:hypothetical protein
LNALEHDDSHAASRVLPLLRLPVIFSRIPLLEMVVSIRLAVFFLVRAVARGGKSLPELFPAS